MQVKKQQLELDIEKRTGSKLEKECLEAVYRKLTNLITWTMALSDSMKLRAMPCRATQDEWVMVEFWQNVVHWRREVQTASVFLPWESHEQYKKAKKIGH